MNNTTKKYQQWLTILKKSIDQSKLQTSLQANKNLIVLYWYIGKQNEQKRDIENWGAKIISSLANDLIRAFPELEGFSERNLLYMKQFAVAYPDFLITQQVDAQLENEKNIITQQAAAQMENGKNIITQQPAAQFAETLWYMNENDLASIPWGHHIYLLDKIENYEQRIWYVKKTIENNWSRSVLKYQVDTDLYQRQEKAKKVNNFHLTLPKAQSDLANQILKDPYKFGFIQLGEQITEFELEQQIIKHIEEFLIELGQGFHLLGQIKMKVSRKIRKLDLLFYHLYLRCFIVIDLKMDEFQWEDSGQMNGYLNVVNKKFKRKEDNATIGIILCGAKDNVDVDFALQNINHPIGVSEYQYIKSLPKSLKDNLPSAKQLQAEVKKVVQNNRRIKTQ